MALDINQKIGLINKTNAHLCPCLSFTKKSVDAAYRSSNRFWKKKVDSLTAYISSLEAQLESIKASLPPDSITTKPKTDPKIGGDSKIVGNYVAPKKETVQDKLPENIIEYVEYLSKMNSKHSSQKPEKNQDATSVKLEDPQQKLSKISIQVKSVQHNVKHNDTSVPVKSIVKPGEKIAPKKEKEDVKLIKSAKKKALKEDIVDRVSANKTQSSKEKKKVLSSESSSDSYESVSESDSSSDKGKSRYNFRTRPKGDLPWNSKINWKKQFL